MKNQYKYTNHPMQPLTPKRQPWAMTQVSSPKKDSAKFAKAANFTSKRQTVQQELLLHEKIEQRVMQKLEKLHEAVSVSRQNRRLERQKSANHTGEIVRALVEHERFRRSQSMGAMPSS